MNPSLKAYVEQRILPQYNRVDAAHRQDHIAMVIAQSLDLAAKHGLDEDMAYTIAAYHDLGMLEDRKTHHLISAKYLRGDTVLAQWFTPEQIETMAEAVEDHRASSERPPRSIYGKVVAEADRFIEAGKIIERTVQYGLDNYPALDEEGHWQRALEHLRAKYGDGGYLKLWFPDSPNMERLESLRRLIRDEESLKCKFLEIYGRLVN